MGDLREALATLREHVNELDPGTPKPRDELVRILDGEIDGPVDPCR